MTQKNDVRRKLRFSLWTLLVVVLLVAVVLGAWFSWVRPRRAFEARRRESIARLDWTGKDAAAEYRTKQIKRAVEQFSYGERSTPSLAYAGINDGAGILNVDWIGVDRGTQVRGIEITGAETVKLSIEPDYVEHDAGVLIFTTTIRKSDSPETWPQLTASVKHQACLIIGENEKSNTINLRIDDTQTGKTLNSAQTSSVGMFMAMLMIALHEVPADLTEFTLDLPQSGSPMLISRRADGWWQASRKEKVQQDVFKVDGGSYVATEGGVEKRADISTLLGVDEDTKLAELESVKHPLGVIRIARKKASLEFRLEEQKDGIGTGTTRQRGEVRWAAQVEE